MDKTRHSLWTKLIRLSYCRRFRFPGTLKRGLGSIIGRWLINVFYFWSLLRRRLGFDICGLGEVLTELALRAVALLSGGWWYLGRIEIGT